MTVVAAEASTTRSPEAPDDAAVCRILGSGARLTGRRLAKILGAEAVIAAGLAVAVAVAGVQHAGHVRGGPWFGTTPGWGGIRIGHGGAAWAMLAAAVCLVLLAVALGVAAATAWLPPLDPRSRRVALAASAIAGQPFVFVGGAIALILAVPAVTGSTVGLATTGWHWVDEALMVGALVVGASLGWRACIAGASAPHRTQIIGGIFVLAGLIFLTLHAAGVTRVDGGGVAPFISPGSFLEHGPYHSAIAT